MKIGFVRSVPIVFAIWLFVFCVPNGGSNLVEEQILCSPEFSSDGKFSLRRVEIYKKVRDPFWVGCHFNSSFSDVSIEEVHLTNQISDNNNSLQSKVLDNETVGLEILGEKASTFNLFCKDSKNIYCLMKVTIGYPPLEATNFRCISLNWTLLECSYDLQNNPAQRPEDEYRLSYFNVAFGWVPGLKCKGKSCPCHFKGSDECWRWDGSENFRYDKDSQFLTFRLSAKNLLGTTQTRYVFDQYEKMLPDFLTSFRVHSDDPHNLVLTWKLPSYVRTFPPGITYRIRYSTSGLENVVFGNFSGSHASTELEVEWPGQSYRVGISLRSGANAFEVGNEQDEWWSSEVTKEVTTPPLPPWEGPEVDAGSFHVSSLGLTHFRTITVMWRRMEPYLQGGDGFGYEVQVLADGNRVKSLPTSLTDTYATFQNMSNDIHYTFLIRPKNIAGIGNSTSRIEVGKTYELFTLKLRFPVSIFYPDKQVWQFRWFPNNSGNVNFTLIWCEDEKENGINLESPCQGKLSWIHLGNLTDVNMTLSDLGSQVNSMMTARFAVSAQKMVDGAIISGGLVWASCPPTVYDANVERTTPILDVKERTSSSALVGWRLECSEWSGNAIQAQVTWCEGVHNISSECEAMQTLECGIDSSSLLIEGLRSSQSYTAWLTIQYHQGGLSVGPPTIFATEEQALTFGAIVLVTFSSFIAILSFSLIAIYSPRKLMSYWHKAKSKLNLPDGIINPKDLLSDRSMKRNVVPIYSSKSDGETVSKILTFPPPISSETPLLAKSLSVDEIVDVHPNVDSSGEVAYTTNSDLPFPDYEIEEKVKIYQLSSNNQIEKGKRICCPIGKNLSDFRPPDIGYMTFPSSLCITNPISYDIKQSNQNTPSISCITNPIEKGNNMYSVLEPCSNFQSPDTGYMTFPSSLCISNPILYDTRESIELSNLKEASISCTTNPIEKGNNIYSILAPCSNFQAPDIGYMTFPSSFCISNTISNDTRGSIELSNLKESSISCTSNLMEICNNIYSIREPLSEYQSTDKGCMTFPSHSCIENSTFYNTRGGIKPSDQGISSIDFSLYDQSVDDSVNIGEERTSQLVIESCNQAYHFPAPNSEFQPPDPGYRKAVALSEYPFPNVSFSETFWNPYAESNQSPVLENANFILNSSNELQPNLNTNLSNDKDSSLHIPQNYDTCESDIQLQDSITTNFETQFPDNFSVLQVSNSSEIIRKEKNITLPSFQSGGVLKSSTLPANSFL